MTSILPCFLAAAEQLLATEKLDQAYYCYIQALQLAPDSVEVHLKLGNVLQKLAKYSAAIASYQKAIALQPDFWEAYHCLGDTLRKQQQWQDAVEAYRQAIALNANFFWSHYHLGSILTGLELWQEAIDSYRKVIALEPDFWQGYHGLGDSYQKLRQHPAAIEAYRQTIKLNPKFFWSHYNLGIILLEQEQWSGAIAAFQQAKALDPDYAPLTAQLAKALQRHGNNYLEQAREHYQQAIAHDPEQTELLISALQIQPQNYQLCRQLGQLLIKQEKFKLLREYYQISLSYAPNSEQFGIYGELNYDLGLAWLSLGNFPQAIACWQTTLEYHPQHLEAHLQLASNFLRQGEPDKALVYYQQTLPLTEDSQILHYCQYVIARLNAPDSTSPSPLNTTPFHIVLYTDCPQIYGAEQSSHVLMKGLAEAGYRVTCMQSLTENHLITAREQLGIPHFWVNAENVDCIADYQNYQGARLPSTLYDSLEPAQSFAQTQPDLIIFADACVMSNIVPKQIAAQLNIPSIIITHRVYGNALKQFAPYLHYLPPIYQQAKEVIVVSQNNLDLLHQQFGLDPSKGQVVYNGIPETFFTKPNLAARQRIRQELDIPSAAIVCSTNARLDVEKGYQFQLAAIAQLQQTDIWSQLYFIWAGEGGYSPHLIKTVQELNVGAQVKFLGNRQDIPDLLDAADIYVMPSLYEGMPIAIMEAMAKGLPVIATAVSGIPEELANTGQLLPDPTIDSSATVQELVQTILNWTQNPQLLTDLGLECQQRAKNLFSEAQAIAHYLKIIARHLGNF